MVKLFGLIKIFILFLVISSCNWIPSKINKLDKLIAEENSFNHSKNYQKDFFEAYTIVDNQYGTKTVVTIVGDKRIMETNSLPNHAVGSFPNPGNPNTIKPQQITYQIPLNPVYTGNPRWVRETGVALNGIKFEPGTNERMVCDTGERYKIEARQNLIDMGLDFNNAHVQPTGAYHYHATPVGVIKYFDTGDDLVHIGFAKDGFPMYYSKSGKYKPSYQLTAADRTGMECLYGNRTQKIQENLEGTKADGTFVQDWVYVEGLGDLDKCNGINIDGNYIYLVTNEYPYVGRYLNGEFIEEHPHDGPPNHHRQNENHPHRERR